MEPATIAVLIITAAFLGLCVWIERNSRQQRAMASRGESAEPAAGAEEPREAADRLRRKGG